MMAKRGRPQIPWQVQLDYEFQDKRVEVREHYDRYLKEKGLPKRCAVETCPLHQGNEFVVPLEWCGNPIVLQLDHVDGNFNNNRPDNLQYLCPNCHSQTETFGKKNAGRIIQADATGYAIYFPERNQTHFKHLKPGKIVIPDCSPFSYPNIKIKLEAELLGLDLTPERREELEMMLEFVKKKVALKGG
jgi:hypothetical protein